MHNHTKMIWNFYENKEKISEKTKREIEKARKEIAKGEFVTLSELKKKYSIK